ncbi:MAG: hypothetical protein ABR562_10265, partial [Thermoplasmatota archaeon]
VMRIRQSGQDRLAFEVDHARRLAFILLRVRVRADEDDATRLDGDGLGVRLALGAQPAQVLRAVVAQGVTLAAVGVVAGVLLAAAQMAGLAAMTVSVATALRGLVVR